MTNYNERLDEIINNLYIWDSSAEGATKIEASLSEAKQALTSLIKELVAEAKPGNLPIFGSQNEAGDISPSDYEAGGYNHGIDQFEQNLLRALESKK